ncbi:MAG: tautomerase family protein [bacterium]
MTMPHIVIKQYPGKTDQQKQALTDAIVADIMAVTGCQEKSVSVAFEEVAVEDWAESVYRPDILENSENLTKFPGYNPFD